MEIVSLAASASFPTDTMNLIFQFLWNGEDIQDLLEEVIMNPMIYKGYRTVTSCKAYISFFHDPLYVEHRFHLIQTARNVNPATVCWNEEKRARHIQMIKNNPYNGFLVDYLRILYRLGFQYIPIDLVCQLFYDNLDQHTISVNCHKWKISRGGSPNAEEILRVYHFQRIRNILQDIISIDLQAEDLVNKILQEWSENVNQFVPSDTRIISAPQHYNCIVSRELTPILSPIKIWELEFFLNNLYQRQRR